MDIDKLQNLRYARRNVTYIKKIINKIQETNLIEQNNKERLFIKIDALLSKENGETVNVLKDIERDLDSGEIDINDYVYSREMIINALRA